MKLSIHNAKISKSRTMAALLALGTSLLLVACGDAESTAGNYIKAQSANSANAEGTTPAPVTPSPMDGTTPAPTPMPAPTTMPAAGDVTKGNTLLVDCMACHNPTGLAKTVILNAAAIPRLDKAYKTSQVALHQGFKGSHFEGAGRLDVEAALKVLTLK